MCDETRQRISDRYWLPLGIFLTDADGNRWVFYGFTLRKAGTQCAHFIKAHSGSQRTHLTSSRNTYFYEVDFADTLERKFPDASEVLQRK